MFGYTFPLLQRYITDNVLYLLVWLYVINFAGISFLIDSYILFYPLVL